MGVHDDASSQVQYSDLDTLADIEYAGETRLRDGKEVGSGGVIHVNAVACLAAVVEVFEHLVRRRFLLDDGNGNRRREASSVVWKDSPGIRSPS